MTELESQDLDELVGILKDAEEGLTAFCSSNNEEEKERSRRSIISFHTTAAMLGLKDLEKAGLEFESFLTGSSPLGQTDTMAVLGFAISSVIDQVQAFTKGNGNGNGAALNFDEILEMLQMDDAGPQSTAHAEPPAEEKSDHDLGDLLELAKNRGFELSIDSRGEADVRINVAFTGSTETLKKLEEVFLAAAPVKTEAEREAEIENLMVQLFCSSGAGLGEGETADKAMIDHLIQKGKELINALSKGDVETAQSILLTLADQQRESSGLYKEIGSLARGLHDSILSFLTTLDPTLHEIVKDKIPDTGNRLEHILEMTEKAAITTMDNVEHVQDRLSEEMERIGDLRTLIGGLKAIGDESGKKLDQSFRLLDSITTLIDKNRSDLDVILGAQDYQDLSGQIILKVTKLLKDIEGKLVNLIRNFGVKTEPKQTDELYGPAHAAMENAMHSQDDVDSLLAEFGF